MKALPDNLEEVSDGYSNFDCQEPEGAEQALREGKGYIRHPAWDHHGEIWFEDGKFYEQVYRYGTHVATIEGNSLKGVFEAVNDQFGWG